SRFYFSADRIYLKNDSPYDIVKYAAKNGYTSFFIDEIQSSTDWTSSLKSLYDEGIRKVYFSGSSAIGVDKGADLSRRAVIHHLPPASFREFLSIKKGQDYQPLTLKDIIQKKKTLLPKYAPSYESMDEYLRYGGMLFDRGEFDKKVENSVYRLIRSDLASIRAVDGGLESTIFKLFYMIASTPSYEANYAKMASVSSMSKNAMIALLSDLQKAGIINILNPSASGHELARKEPKIYFPVPFSAFFTRQIFQQPPLGRLREEFFVQHAVGCGYVKGAEGRKSPDFSYAGHTFEVGGVGKDNAQGPQYRVIDGILVEGNRIPLFLFGFLSPARTPAGSDAGV
ncbi:MAG: AAA family ATPase, partial [Patescibacteria group bacterium]